MASLPAEIVVGSGAHLGFEVDETEHLLGDWIAEMAIAFPAAPTPFPGELRNSEAFTSPTAPENASVSRTFLTVAGLAGVQGTRFGVRRGERGRR